MREVWLLMSAAGGTSRLKHAAQHCLLSAAQRRRTRLHTRMTTPSVSPTCAAVQQTRPCRASCPGAATCCWPPATSPTWPAAAPPTSWPSSEPAGGARADAQSCLCNTTRVGSASPLAMPSQAICLVAGWGSDTLVCLRLCATPPTLHPMWPPAARSGGRCCCAAAAPSAPRTLLWTCWPQVLVGWLDGNIHGRQARACK